MTTNLAIEDIKTLTLLSQALSGARRICQKILSKFDPYFRLYLRSYCLRLWVILRAIVEKLAIVLCAS